MPAPITPPEGYVCIGGPKDGQRVASMHGHPRFITTDQSTRSNPVRVRYILECLRGNPDEPGVSTFFFWRMETMGVNLALHMLLETYKGTRP